MFYQLPEDIQQYIYSMIQVAYSQWVVNIKNTKKEGWQERNASLVKRMLQVIEYIESKNVSAFEQTYLAYRNLMYHVANQILHDSYLAEDAVSESLIKIAKNYSSKLQ